MEIDNTKLTIDLIDLGMVYSTYGLLLSTYSDKSDYKKRLRNCSKEFKKILDELKLNIEIPASFMNKDEVIVFLQKQDALQGKIIDNIKSKYAGNADQMFVFSVLLSGVIFVIKAGEIQMITEIKSLLYDSSSKLRIPHRIIDKCLDDDSLSPLKDFIVDTETSTDTIVNYGRIIMGGNFENISNSTVINESHLSNALNTVQSQYGSDVKNALTEISTHIKRYNEVNSGNLLDGFNKELCDTTPNQAVLTTLWDALVRTLPDVSKVSTAIATVTKIFQ